MEKNMISIDVICNATSNWSIIHLPLKSFRVEKCHSQNASFADIWGVKQSSLGMATNC